MSESTPRRSVGFNVFELTWLLLAAFGLGAALERWDRFLALEERACVALEVKHGR